jgi:ferrous iron transport protein B
MLNIALGGNPNCGKTALFNALTGIRQKTGNWPGVTVDRKEGLFSIDNNEFRLVDLPGVYSLDASSLDEQVSRDYLLSGESRVLLNVVDSSNLERNLYFTVQLLEMGLPIVIALNMMDVARKQGINIDVDELSRQLGCPVIPIVATTGEGIDELKQALQNTANQADTVNTFTMPLSGDLEKAVAEVESTLNDDNYALNTRWVALKMLEGDDALLESASSESRTLVETYQERIEATHDDDADIYIAEARYNYAHSISQAVMTQQGKVVSRVSDRLDKIFLHRFWGIPIFLFIMYLMFMFTINFGGAFIDVFDGVAGAIFVDGFGAVLERIHSPTWLNVLLASGIGGGIQVVATFIPIIACLYVFLSALEDSGYMARAAFVMDRAMRAVGLPGKAFIPMIVGFGCNVPAVMATRTLEHERERKLTILMNPFMSCGARLPVYALFVAAFFPDHGQNLVFLLYLIGIAVAVLTGLIMRNTFLSGESSAFIMELPAYHVPTIKGVMLRTWDRVRLFIKEAGQVIVVMVLILNVLNSIGSDGSFGNEDSEKSILSSIGKTITPIFYPMGITDENWPATVGIFTGILAKEAVVGTLDSLYSQIAQNEGLIEEEGEFEFWSSIQESLGTVSENLQGVADGFLDPLGLDIGEVSNLEAAAEEQSITDGVFGAMIQRFDGMAGAFAYLLFVLLYFPCVATIGAIARETGRSWAVFVAMWTSGVAYICACLFYQIATFSRNPESSSVWIVGLMSVAIGTIFALRYWGMQDIERDGVSEGIAS